MTSKEISRLISETKTYNLHSHTEYCDGHAPMASIVEAAAKEGFRIWGITPHSPIPIESGCNMLRTDVGRYISRVGELQDKYGDELRLLTGMEVDFLGRDFGPHIDYFQTLPLDYRIGSVHFVPNQDGILIDCDGSAERFRKNLKAGYADDLRYVVEKYFEQVLTMQELGGFEILGHFDKIIGNACTVDPNLENEGWYESLIKEVIRGAADSGVIVEINTKAIESRGRFYPSEIWWPMLKECGVKIAVNSDCHSPELTNLGRNEALEKFSLLH
ncbi:MAG: histidinol-phosphatase [Muribaculaceae bacterium]|nr:histidinol-phosphatase [Muribaculaceae bacterium]